MPAPNDCEFGTPSDNCVGCLAKLDPLKLEVNIKYRFITAVCENCGKLNPLGKWQGKITYSTNKSTTELE